MEKQALQKQPTAWWYVGVSPGVPLVYLNPQTVYNYMDAVIMCRDYDLDPPNILESDGVKFFSLNYIIMHNHHQ